MSPLRLYMVDIHVFIQKFCKNSIAIMFAKVVEYIQNIKKNIVNLGINKLPEFTLQSDKNQYKFVKFCSKEREENVYVIQNIATKKLFACKKIQKKYNYTKKYLLSKFNSDLILTKLANHNNLICLYELIEHENDLYLIFEYCENGDLYSYCIKQRLCVDMIERYFKQLINGLEHMHKHGVAHKDLKLEKLLLDSNYNLKISNSGRIMLYTKIIENHKTICSSLIGSAPYLAPELYNATSYDVEKADVFSCGVILYVFLFNHMPFSKACTSCNSYSYFIKNAHNNNYSLISRLPRDIKTLLLGMLEHDPNQRYSLEDIKKNKWFLSIS